MPRDDDFSYEIKESLGTFGINEKSGWTTEVNLISWNGRDPKYDIRPWAPEHAKMGKGITLRKEELLSLRDLLNKLDLD